MNHKVKNSITIFFLIAGAVAMYFILRDYNIKEVLAIYKNFNPLILLLYILVVTILYITLTWRWNIILSSRNVKIPFRKLFIYRIIGTAINFVTPGPRVGGEPTQAALLTKHGVEFTEGLSTIMIDKIIDTTTCGILFIVGVFLVGVKYSFPRNAEIALTIGGAAFVTIVAIFYYRMLNNKHFFLHIFRFFRLDRAKAKWLKDTEEGIERVELIMIEFYKHNKKAFVQSLGISIFTWVIMFFEYKLATTLLGLHLGAIELFFIITFIGIALLFPIPMAVGALEVGQLSAFAIINLPANAGIALAFLVRMKDIAWALFGISLLAFYGFHPADVVKKKYKTKFKKE